MLKRWLQLQQTSNNLKISHQVPDFLLQMAEEFHQIGINSAINAKKDSEKRLRHIVAGAVNMGFAAELLIKGLLLVTAKKSPWDHKLTDLFSLLDQSIKRQIESKFNEQQLKPNTEDSLRSYIFTIAKEDEKKNNYSLDTSFENFLNTHDKTFETWRYVHEVPEDGFSYQMEFESMNNFIKILLEILDSIEWEGRFHRLH